MESTIKIGADYMGDAMFQHHAGMYRVTLAMRNYGMSIYVEEMYCRNASGPYALGTAVRAEHIDAMMLFLKEGVSNLEPRFAIVTETFDSAGDTNITRSTVFLSNVVRHYEDMWCDQDVKDIRPKLLSMRVGDSFALGRKNRRETVVCIADRVEQP